MSAIDVLPHRKLPDFLVTSKEVGVDTRRLETPIRARPTDVFEDEEEPLDVAYGFGEVHIEVSTNELKELAEGSNADFEKSIVDQRAAVRDDEIAAALIQFTGRGIVNVAGMETLVDILAEHFDVLIGPLMSEPLDNVKINVNPGPFDRFLENTERFLEAAKDSATEAAVLGAIPSLDWDRMEEIFELELRRGVDGFCVDFLDKKPTAQHRVNQSISPFMERLGKEQRYRNSLLYAVNAYRGKNQTDGPGSPAEDFFIFGLGFDVLGGRYYRSRSGWSGDDEVEFRCFDHDTYEQEYVSVATLKDELPEVTGFDHQYVLEMARDDDQRGRFQVAFGIEQMNVAYDELRNAIHDGRTAAFVTDRPGTDDRLQTLMETVQNAYDDGHSNPSLSSY